MSRWINYSSVVPGKWVLSGEHTVLRGGNAIALPHPNFRLSLNFTVGGTALTVVPDLGAPVVHELLRTAKVWIKIRGVEMDLPYGELRIESSIPYGAGLGSSAALSVSIARWVLSAHRDERPDKLDEQNLARELEDHFHGKSSGMDVAVVSLGVPIFFSMSEGPRELGLQHLPLFRFKDTGLRASTKECVRHVESFRMENSKEGKRLDQLMGEATTEALRGLMTYDSAFGASDAKEMLGAINTISKSFMLSYGVFSNWGLIPSTVAAQVEKLNQSNFIGSRLTGAGGGGFIVGLLNPRL